MEIRQLKTFQTVGRLLSFNRAARVLHYAQSTVSAQIRLLEEELDVRLFDRLGKTIVLTEAGNQLMEYAGRLLAMEAETRTRVSGLNPPTGTLTIRAPQSIGTHVLPEIIREYHRKYPGIGFDINACAYTSLKEEFRSGITDLAFLLQDSVSSADLKAEVLGYTRILTVCAPGHPLAGRNRFELGDFNGQTLIIPKHDCSYRMAFERELTDARVVPGSKIRVNSIEIVRNLVQNGTGIALMPEMAIQKDIQRKQLCVLPWPGKDGYETGILMIRHADKWLSPQIRAFMDMVGSYFRGTGYW